LTHCLVDESTFGCTPTRVVGDASTVELASDFNTDYAVWSDSRDGNREIYFKRTDTTVLGTAPRLTTGCTDPTTAHVDVTFDLNRSCPTLFAGERMLRYRVYWSTAAGGPYD